MYRQCYIRKVPVEIRGIRSRFRMFSVTQHDYSSKDFSSKEIISSLLPFQANANNMKEKLKDLVIWYEQLTGMDEVRMMQNRVIEAQDRFIAVQEKRRDVGKELTSFQSRLKEIHSELDTTSRGEERYLQLVTTEHSILKDERRLVTEFALLEREERESFNILSSYVKESHEKERAQAERTKYWSILGSIIGTVIGVAGSSINNEFKMRELRKLVKESVLRNSASLDTSTSVNSALTELVNNMKNILGQQTSTRSSNEVSHGKNEELLRKLEKSLNSLQHVQGGIASEVQEMKGMLQSAQRYKGQLVTIPQDMESMIVKQQYEIKLVVAAVSIMGIIVPIIVTFLSRS